MRAVYVRALAGTLAVCLARSGAGQAAALQIQVVEGEGAMYATGARSVRPIVVLVTDELGRPAPGVTVAFLLPDEEPSGAFGSGLKTDIQQTGRDGRVSLAGIQWGRQAGAVRLRITASSGELRAGTVCQVHLTEWASQVDRAAGGGGGGGKRWWVLAAGAAAGAVIGGMSVRGGGPPAPAAAATTASAVQIGPPTITIGRP